MAKLKVLKFKKGITRIVFPVLISYGMFFDFNTIAEQEINNIKKIYKPRKDTLWFYEVKYPETLAYVVAEKHSRNRVFAWTMSYKHKK